MPRRLVAVITGGNAGIGLVTADRLLEEHGADRLTVCLACRNSERANDAKNSLLQKHPGAQVSTVVIDTSSVASVLKAAEALKEKYDHIDFLYLNAGCLTVNGVNWDKFWQGVFSMKIGHMLLTGEGLLKQEDGVTSEGLQRVFATNVFGHFVLVRAVRELLGGELGTSQVIWTSSSNADASNFSISDPQHVKGTEPYSSSKFCADMLSVAFNNKMNDKGIYSHTVCPGLVITNLTYAILPRWFWVITFPFLILMRIFVPSLCLDAYNGSEALVWLSTQKVTDLGVMTKFCSRTSVFGSRSVYQKPMSLDVSQTAELYEKLEKLEASVLGKLDQKKP